MGDRHPDCYHASKQLSSEFCQDFNEKYPDSPKVYYQSYASIVKHTLGDNLLSIPNLLMYLAGAPKMTVLSPQNPQNGVILKKPLSAQEDGVSLMAT